MNARIFMLGSSLFVIATLATPSSAQEVSEAKTLYDENCKKCHGVRGIPPKAMKTKFEKIVAFDAAFVGKHSTDSIAKVLARGKGEDMKPFKDKMTPQQLALVAQYVHDLAVKKAGQ